MERGLHGSGYAALREQLIAARKNAGLTQEQVAARLGRSQSFVTKYEGGERRLDVVDFAQICRILGADPASLLEPLIG